MKPRTVNVLLYLYFIALFAGLFYTVDHGPSWVFAALLAVFIVSTLVFLGVTLRAKWRQDRESDRIAGMARGRNARTAHQQQYPDHYAQG